MLSLAEATELFVAEFFPMYSGTTRRPGSRSVVTLTPCQDCQKRKVFQDRLPHTDSAKRSSPSLVFVSDAHWSFATTASETLPAETVTQEYQEYTISSSAEQWD